MNYTIKHIINNIIEFSYIKNTLFLISKNGELLHNNELINKGEYSFFGIYNNLQIVFDELNFSSLLYNDQGKLIDEIQDYALRHIFTFTNGNSLVGGNDGNNVFYGIYNFSKKTLLRHFDKLGFNGVYQVLNNDLFLSQNNEKFGVFNFENNLIWQHTYSDLLGLENPDIIGLYSDIIKIEDSIYLYLAGRDKNNDNQGTFCIDTETGKTKHIYKNIISFSYPEGDLLYNLHNNKLNILNTITQEIETIDFSEELKKYNIETDSKFAVQNGLIYFSQSMGDIVSKIGILSPKEKKLLWKYEFPKGSGQVGNLQVQGNRIYAHTQDKTLHIFEKT